MPTLRTSRLLVLGAVVATLASLAFAAPSLAQDEPGGPSVTPVTARTRQIHGTVKSVGSANFVVTTARHGDVTVTLPSGGLSLPRGLARRPERARSHLIATLGDLHAQDRVVVQGRGQTDGTFVARRIHVLHQARTQHVVGTFKSFNGSTLTLTVNGADRAFTVGSSTVVRPADRSLSSISGTPTITVVSRDGTTATGVQIHG
jgi:hypothetical protein